MTKKITVEQDGTRTISDDGTDAASAEQKKHKGKRWTSLSKAEQDALVVAAMQKLGILDANGNVVET